jgi:hypothetical protein
MKYRSERERREREREREEAWMRTGAVGMGEAGTDEA